MKRFARILAPFVLAAGLISSLGATAAHASGPEICTDQGSNSQCMNHAGGSYSPGAHVIGWSAGDSHNDFEFVNLSRMCGNGTVTSTCPFTVGSGLNSAYAGSQIVGLYDPDNRCPGGTSSTDTNASQQPCPDAYGENGGWSTVDILAFAETDTMARYVLINKNFSNQLYAGGTCYGVSCSIALDSPGHGLQINLNGGDSEIQSGHPGSAGGQFLWAELG